MRRQTGGKTGMPPGNYEVCARRLSPERRWESLVLSGGLVQYCDVLRELIIERFDCPARLCTASEETLVGLLMLVLVASGRFDSVAAANAGVGSRQ